MGDGEFQNSLCLTSDLDDHHDAWGSLRDRDRVDREVMAASHMVEQTECLRLIFNLYSQEIRALGLQETDLKAVDDHKREEGQEGSDDRDQHIGAAKADRHADRGGGPEAGGGGKALNLQSCAQNRPSPKKAHANHHLRGDARGFRSDKSPACLAEEHHSHDEEHVGSDPCRTAVPLALPANEECHEGGDPKLGQDREGELQFLGGESEHCLYHARSDGRMQCDEFLLP